MDLRALKSREFKFLVHGLLVCTALRIIVMNDHLYYGIFHLLYSFAGWLQRCILTIACSLLVLLSGPPAA